MKKNIYLLFLLFTLATYSFAENNTTEKGLLDLRNAGDNSKKIFQLSGEWEFYWKKLLSSDDFIQGKNSPPDTYISLPSIWNNLKINGKKIGGHGYATLKLKILHNFKGKEAGIKLQEINFSYKLYADGKLIAKAGEISESPENFKAQYLPQSVYFIPASDETELILNISNFYGPRGGAWKDILFGEKKHIEKETTGMLITDTILIGSRLSLIIIFFIVFFISGQYAAFFYAIQIFFLLLRIAGAREMFFLRIFSDVDFDFFFKLYATSSFLQSFFLVLAIYGIFNLNNFTAGDKKFKINLSHFFNRKSGIDEKFIIISFVLNVLFIIIFFAARPEFYLKLVNVYYLISAINMIYPFKMIIYQIKNNKKNIFFLYAYLAFFFIFCYESLIQYKILKIDYFYPFVFLSLFKPGSSIAALRIQNQVILYMFEVLISIYVLVKIYQNQELINKKKYENINLSDFFSLWNISTREKEIIDLALQGMSNKEIAYKLFITEGTVKFHLNNIFFKTNTKSRSELIIKALNKSLEKK